MYKLRRNVGTGHDIWIEYRGESEDWVVICGQKAKLKIINKECHRNIVPSLWFKEGKLALNDVKLCLQRSNGILGQDC